MLSLSNYDPVLSYFKGCVPTQANDHCWANLRLAHANCQLLSIMKTIFWVITFELLSSHDTPESWHIQTHLPETIEGWMDTSLYALKCILFGSPHFVSFPVKKEKKRPIPFTCHTKLFINVKYLPSWVYIELQFYHDNKDVMCWNINRVEVCGLSNCSYLLEKSSFFFLEPGWWHIRTQCQRPVHYLAVVNCLHYQ